MKAYRIKNDIVAAHNEEQAIETWAAELDEDPKTAGPVEEIDPATFEVHYEQDDGSFEPGPLSAMMPENEPQVLIDSDHEC